MPNKKQLFLMPGLAASSKIFDYIKLPKEKFELHFLEWLIPESFDESLEHYTKRLVEKITEPNPVLIGVSFGGILVQEMSKYIPTEKIIIISSIKDKNEIPKRLKFLQKLKLYKFFPSKKIAHTVDFSKYNFTKSIQKKTALYNKFFNVRDEQYLDWAIFHVLNWKPDQPCKNLVHIHGTDDSIFPIKHIKNCIKIEGGTHAMIINKGRKISTILQEIF